MSMMTREECTSVIKSIYHGDSRTAEYGVRHVLHIYICAYLLYDASVGVNLIPL